MKMNENIENIENRKIKEILEENKFLRAENTQLKQDNTVLGHELTYFKEYSADLEEEINKNNFHQQEKCNLCINCINCNMGKHHISEELAIEQAENGYVPYNGDDI